MLGLRPRKLSQCFFAPSAGSVVTQCNDEADVKYLVVVSFLACGCGPLVKVRPCLRWEDAVGTSIWSVQLLFSVYVG